MGIYEDLKFVEGQGTDIGPGRKWDRLFELLVAQKEPDESPEDPGYLAGRMINSELSQQGISIAELSRDEWAVIGSRFAAVAGARPAQCELEDGFFQVYEEAQAIEVGDHA